MRKYNQLVQNRTATRANQTIYDPEHFYLVPPASAEDAVGKDGKIYATSQMTYGYLIANPDGHCVQCAFSGGKYAHVKKNVTVMIQDKEIDETHEVNECNFPDGFDKGIDLTS